jgi:hypothetical protein
MRQVIGALVAAIAWAAAASAFAQDPPDLRSRIQSLEASIAEQSRQLAAQKAALEDQEARLKAQEAALGQLRGEALASLRGAGEPASDEGSVRLAQSVPANPTPTPNPETPKVAVGEPGPPIQVVEVAALPRAVSVLTPKGVFVADPLFRYVHGSSNRLVFRGVEIITGIQIGVLEANDADRNTIAPALSLRYGVTRRLEVEAVIPYLDRSDRVTTVVQRDESVSRSLSLEGQGLADWEVGFRYQLNAPRPGKPVYIALFRYKNDNGTGPYDVEFDEAGVAQTLATGSGFKAVQAGVSFLYPTDPAVIFGGVSYLHSFPETVGRTIAAVEVGRVEPGDAYSFNGGFGFAINPQFSFSLGYEHTHVFRTVSELNGTRQKSLPLEVGQFTFGWSMRLSERLTLTNTYDIGVTSDAPDVSVTVRLPYRF